MSRGEGSTTAAAGEAVGAARWSTPRLLRVCLAAGLAAAAVVLGGAELEVLALQQAVRAVGQERAPNIVAAEDIAANVADLDGLAARALLEAKLRSTVSRTAFEARRQAVTRSLVVAAEQWTSPEAERAPILTLVDGFGTYLQRISEATLRNDQGDVGEAIPDFRQATDLLHGTLLATAQSLAATNRQELDRAYAIQRRAVAPESVVDALAVAAVAALASIQIFLARRTRRLLNLPLLIATGLTAVFLVTLRGQLARSAALLHTAVEAFDSMHALLDARTLAYDARGSEARALLDAIRAPSELQAFRATARRVSKAASHATSNDPTAAAAPDGLLDRELHRVQFAGELNPARSAAESYARYLAWGDAMRAEEAAGQHFAAVSDCLNPIGMTASAEFAHFDRALQTTIDVNRGELLRAINAAGEELRPYPLAAAVIASAVALFAFLGLRSRLREYPP